jgi:cytoskeleton protein RodZ
MTMNTQQTGGTETTHIPLGAKLQSAREAQRIERKDAAAQLRLNESVIDMIENNSFPENMPPIFIRGYTRAYGKLLQIPEDVMVAGLAPIKQRVITQEAQLAMPVTHMKPQRGSGYAMKGVTAAIILTLLWLVNTWWHSHSAATVSVNADDIAVSIPAETSTSAALVPAGITIQPPQVAGATPAMSLPLTVPPVAATPSIGSSAAPTSATPAPVVASTPSAAKIASAAPSIPAYKRAAMATQPAKPVNADTTDNDVDGD